MRYDKTVMLAVNICVMQLAYNRGVERSEGAPEHKVWQWASRKPGAQPGA